MSPSWNTWDRLRTGQMDTPGSLLVATKSRTISGYLAPVGSDSFGCLPDGGRMSGEGCGVNDFLRCCTVNYQGL